MQNLAVTSQYSNSGRRGNLSSSSFQSLVMNGVLPPNEDGKVEGIKMKPPKKIYFPKPKSIGDGFPDKKDGDFRKERTKDWEIEEDNVFGKGKDSASGPFSVPYSDVQRKLEELERERNRPETQEEKERREYGYKIVDKLKELSNLNSILDAYNGGIKFFNDFFSLNDYTTKTNPNYREFDDTIYYMIEDLLSSIDYDSIRRFVVNKDRNINQVYSARKIFQEWNPPLIIKAQGWSDNPVEKIIMEMIVLFIDGSPYLQIIMTIQRGPNVYTSKVIYSEKLD